MADLNDQALGLLERIARQDEQSLETFYHLFEASVYRFALSRLNDPLDASDVLNEVMMEVWKSASRFQGRSKVSTWLLGITHHKVIDRMRKHARTRADELQDDLPDDSGISIERAIACTQDAGQLKYCLDRLPDNHRQVVHLVFFEELGYEEIAGILECPAGTVKSRIFHAKAMLKRCLAASFDMTGV
jgi:RNA polymerase sigma-70 factor (ECF subfamily)